MIKIFVYIFMRQASTIPLPSVKLKYGDSQSTIFKEKFYRTIQSKIFLNQNKKQHLAKYAKRKLILTQLIIQ